MGTRHSRRAIAASAGLVLGLSALVAPLAANAHTSDHGTSAKQPKRVVIIVVDALRKDLVDKYNMKNVKALMRGGTDFENSYLGHMGSETVVTHNVITSGKLPKNMGWTDEGYRDVDGVLAPKDGVK